MMEAAAVPSDPPAPPSPRRPRWARIALRLASVLVGLVVGLVIAELAFRYRDGGAFPHLNVYVADPVLGLRLRPGATEKVSFGGNPITSVRINREGFRGADLPPPGKDEVLVVGDSQVFGLGVEEDQTFSARLASRLHRTVVNAGVPTYGPAEYRAVIAEQLAARHPKTVVLAINLVNDLFEAEHANKDRHVVWDGWAVRKETAPASVTEFPGRDFLFRRSHLFFALRRWWHRHDALDPRGFASEGTWRDLVAEGKDVASRRHADEVRAHAHDAALAKVQHELTSSEDAIDGTIREVLSNRPDFPYHALDKARANPGDIVEEQDELAEGGRLVAVTAEQIRTAAAVRAKLRRELAAWAKAHRNSSAKDALAELARRDQLLSRLSELDAERIQAALRPPLADYLRDVRQLVERHGARLVVVILPIDVQVSPAEWAKYGHAPIDMTSARPLIDELLELCRSLGVSALDATVPLAAAEPGAFLDHDIHMSPRGHAALAAALARTLAAPPPAPARASERSPVPVPAVWQHAPEVIVTGSTAAGCETKQVREWLRVLCTQGRELTPTGIAIERDDGGEAMAMTMPHGVSLLVPVVEGRELAATITWPDRTRVLHVRWPAGGKPVMAFDPPHVLRAKTSGERELLEYGDASRGRSFASPVERAICGCWALVYHGASGGPHDPPSYDCTGVYGAPDAACTQTYDPDAQVTTGGKTRAPWLSERRARCEHLLACIRRDPASPP